MFAFPYFLYFESSSILFLPVLAFLLDFFYKML